MLRSVLRHTGLARLLHSSPISSYDRGTVIYSEDDPASACYLVLEGACESRHPSPGGGEETLALGPGDVFGEGDVLSERGYQSAIRATEDSVLLRMGRNRFQRLLDERPELAGYLNLKSPATPRARAFPTPLASCKMVMVASLSDGALESRIVSALGNAVSAETPDAPVLVVEFTKDESAIQLDETAVLRAEPDRASHVLFSTLRISAAGLAEESTLIGPLLSRLSHSFSRILVRAGVDSPMEALVSTLDVCGAAYVLLRQTPEDLYALSLLMRELRGIAHMDLSRVKPVLYFAHGERAHGLCHWVEQSSGLPVHAVLHESGGPAPGASFPAAIRRLAREICGTRVGLALSSGAARGLAHIGVIQVLEENGIEVDVIAGASMGAYVASVWGCGYDGRFMEALAREIRSPWELRYIVDLIFPPHRGFLRGERARLRLKRAIGDAHFSDLFRPIRIISTRLDTLERVVFTHGEVASAVHASIAIPGICVPVTIEDVHHIDGGISDPLPVDVLREMGIDRVIAVNTILNPEHLRQRIDYERELSVAARRVLAPLRALNRRFNPFASGNLFDIMMRGIHGVQIRVAEASCLSADIVLRPHSCDGSWHDFSNAAKYIALGRQAALDHLPGIKALVQGSPHASQHTSRKLAVAA